MKKALFIWINTFLITLMVFTLISLGTLRHLNIQLPFLKLVIGAFFISFFIALGIFIFKNKKGHPLLNTVLGYLLMVPSIFIMRTLFCILIFRYSFIIYLFIVLVAVIYTLAVMVVSKRYKKEVEELNRLLDKPQSNNSEKSE